MPLPANLPKYSKNKFAYKLMDGDIWDDKYIMVENIIFYKDIYLVLEYKFKYKILQETHDTALAGHPRYFRTYQ